MIFPDYPCDIWRISALRIPLHWSALYGIWEDWVIRWDVRNIDNSSIEYYILACIGRKIVMSWISQNGELPVIACNSRVNVGKIHVIMNARLKKTPCCITFLECSCLSCCPLFFAQTAAFASCLRTCRYTAVMLGIMITNAQNQRIPYYKSINAVKKKRENVILIRVTKTTTKDKLLT